MVSGKKVFSVPVGKLRNNAARCKTGSYSGSSSRSKYQNRLLRKNNRDLAYALAKQKERNKISMDENLRLTSLLHEKKLEVHGWKKKFESNQKTLSDYHDCVVNHIKDAVRYSVLLTESLKLAMTIPVEEGASFSASGESSQKKESQNGNNNVIGPLRQRVNPMISGHTIKYATVNLKRLNVDVVERVTDSNDGATSEEIIENFQEPTIESSQQSSNVGLSTCLEEDEDESQSRNVIVTSTTEMHEDSFRRRTVSFRNRTLDKSKQAWHIDVADTSSSKLTGDSHEPLSQLSIIGRNSNQCGLSGEWECVAVPEGLDKLRPVVALNDVSKFLQYSNSVNVLKLQMSQEVDKLSSIARRSPNSPDGEKENLPSNEILPEPPQLESNIQEVEASKTLRDEDPLEGTSWMYRNNYNEPKRRGRKPKDLKKASKHDNKKINLNDKKTKTRSRTPQSVSTIKSGSLEGVVNSNLVNQKDFVTEKDIVPAEVANAQEQESSRNLENEEKDLASISQPAKDICNESLDPSFKGMAEMRDDMLKNLAVQSTPICSDNRSPPRNNVSPSSLSAKLGSLDRSSCSVSLNVSPELSRNAEHSRAIDGEISGKELSPALFDAKLHCNAFVTVRVKRLKCQVDPEDEKLLDSDNEGEKVNRNAVDHQIETDVESDDFAGFENEDKNLENAKEMKESLSPIFTSGITSTENSRTDVEVTYSSSKISDPSNFDSSSLDSSSRPKRKAAPTVLKEPSLNIKMRRETIGKKKKRKEKKKK